jgi:glycosyltransferase involved in cell wall biosynthesis
MTILSYHNVKVPSRSAHSLLTVQTSLDLSSIADVYYYANRGDRRIGFKEVYGADLKEYPSFYLKATISSHKGLASIEKRVRVIYDVMLLGREQIFVYVTQAKPLRYFLWLKGLGFKIKIIVEPHSETEAWGADAFNGVDGIIYTTQALRQKLSEKYSISTQIPAKVFYHRIRGTIPATIPATKSLCQEIAIGYIGGLEAWKGVDTIIEALSFLPENFRVKFIGGAPEGSDYNRLLLLADKFGVADRLSFSGRVPQAALAAAAEDVDIFVLPLLDSTQGSLPMKMFDYMCLGRPIISASQESLREVLDEKSALFYLAGSAESLAQQVLLLKGDSVLAGNLAVNAFDAIKLYTVDIWRGRMKTFIEEIGAKR